MELVDSYVLKDILAFDKIKSSKTLLALLRLLAFQVGNLVSLNELATELKIDTKTVDRYLDLLEKTFIIKKITGFSRNLRKEVTSKAKYYFVDNGVRNGLIKQFQPIEFRGDIGLLWENFIVMEFIKKAVFSRIMPVDFYFWRTYGGAEVDLIVQYRDHIEAYECKYSAKKKIKPPLAWKKRYPDVNFHVVTKENYLDFFL